MPAILLAVTAASAASAASGPTISAVTPYRIPVDGLTQVTVTGSGFTAASASTPTCRISTFRYITPWYAAGPLSCQPRASLGPNPPGVSFDKPSPTNYTAPATIINDTHLSCTPPAVTVEGVAVLAVSLDNATFSVPSSAWPTPTGPTCLEFFALFSSAVGQRPYFSEQNGSVIVSTHADLEDMLGLTVSATLDEPPTTLLSKVPIIGGAKAKLPFSLDALPPRVRTTLRVTLHLPSPNPWTSSGAVTHQRRFERVPPAANGRSSAVDHETGALLVDGDPFLITG